MSCVADEVLLAFSRGELEQADRARVLEHVDGCAACQAAIATLADASAQRLGPYRLLERLGHGGVGEVYLAEGRRGARCVVKRLLPELSGNGELARRFRQEAAMLAGLSHPNIGRLLELGEADGTVYLALEYIDGLDFARLLERFKRGGSIVPAALTVELIRQAALGLAAAHRATDARGKPLHLIHRDVSPHNLMVGYDGVVKVIDFGMAQAAANEATRTGVVVGKLRYHAPEQARGDKVDARCDVFALGLVLQELLTGRRSYAATGLRALERDVQQGRTPREPPADVWVMPQLWELSRQCVAPKPAERFASMAELERELARLQRQLSLELSPEALRALLAT